MKKSSRRSSGRQITIQEDTRIPGTNTILEAGDVISVNESSTTRNLSYNRGIDPDGLRDWTRLNDKNWFNMTIGTIKHYFTVDDDVNKYSRDGWNPILNAARYSSGEVVQYLVDLGAKVKRVMTSRGLTPLMFASMYNADPNVAQILIRRGGADVNETFKDGMTPLMFASYNSNPNVTQALINNGADVNMQDHKGRTALDYAKSSESKGSGKMIQILIDNGAE